MINIQTTFIKEKERIFLSELYLFQFGYSNIVLPNQEWALN